MFDSKYVGFVFLWCVLFLVDWSSCLDQGDKCGENDQIGYCVNIGICDAARQSLAAKQRPQICGWNGTEPYVCCIFDTKNTSNVVNDTSNGLSDRQQEKKCKEFPNLPPRPEGVGQKAYDKCIEYMNVSHPCFPDTGIRGDRCYEPPPHIIGGEGVDAKRGEFAHMALLGYVTREVQWLCGASVISDRHLLTAAHCSAHPTLGPVKIARLGILQRSDPMRDSQLYRVKQVTLHPEYHSPSKYNDIAVIELDRVIKFINKMVVPACLMYGTFRESELDASATGWGALSYYGDNADTLQKLELVRFSDEECQQQYQPQRLLRQGYDNASQMCYGHRTVPRDTCQILYITKAIHAKMNQFYYGNTTHLFITGNPQFGYTTLLIQGTYLDTRM